MKVECVRILGAELLCRPQGLSRVAVATGEGRQISANTRQGGRVSQCLQKAPTGPANCLGVDNNRVGTVPTGQGAFSSQDWRLCGGLASWVIVGYRITHTRLPTSQKDTFSHHGLDRFS